jgi:WD40 repeat protein
MAYDAFVSYSHAADGRLAPALQQGMQRLAKSWFQPRALRVFRDESALSANPHLWSSIERALDEGTWFVLLASPDAVASQWVNRELEYWLAHKSVDNILPVVTDGTWEWTEAGLEGTAVLPAFRNAFGGEPRHIDLRWAHDVTDVDLRNSRFRDAVAQLAAPVHGVAKDDLESEDVRHHRRARRLARAAIATLVVLLVAAIIGGGIAVHSTSVARAQTREANTQRLVGQSAALIDTKRDLAMLLALEANRGKDRLDTRGALFNALVHDPTFLGYIRQGSSNMQTVAFLGNGRVVVGHNDGTITTIDVASHRVVGPVVHAFDTPVVETRVTPDNRSIVAIGSDGDKIGIFDAATGRRIREFAPAQPIGEYAISNDGRFLAAGGYVEVPAQPKVFVWDLRSSALVTTLSPDPSLQTAQANSGSNFAAAAFSPKGLLAVSGNAGTISLFDTTSFRPVGKLGGVPDVVGATLEFSRDGTRLVSGDASNHGLMLWDVAARRAAWPQRVDAEQFTVRVSADNNVLYTNRFGKIVTLAATTGRPTDTSVSLQAGFVCDLAVSPDGRTLAAANCNEPTVALFALDGRATIGPVLDRLAGVGAYSPDGRLVTTGNDLQVTIFDAHSFRPLSKVRGDLNLMQFTSDSKYFLVVDGHANAGRFDYRTNRFAGATHTVPADGINTSVVDPATGHLAIGYDDGTVIVIDANGDRVAPTGVHITDRSGGAAVNALSFTPDGRRLAVAAQNETTTVFATRTGKRVAPPIPGAANARYSPDGRLLVTAAFNGTIAFYDATTLKLDGAPIIGSRAWAKSIVFSRDSRLLATVSLDSTARVFDVQTHQQLGPALPAVPDSDASLRPDGLALATEFNDSNGVGWVQVWDLDSRNWRTAACNEAGRNLTHSEWAQYLGGPYNATCAQWPAGSS